jgi:hemoglobin-like flavoprotein
LVLFTVQSNGFSIVARFDSPVFWKVFAMNIQESLQRILQEKDQLAEMFYDYFLEEYPELRPLFAKVDFKRQRVLLTTALMVVERGYTHPAPAVEQYLQYLGTKHHEFRVPKEAYAKWNEAMLVTMQRFHGEHWSEELAQQWRSAIELACELMFQGYEERVTV